MCLGSGAVDHLNAGIGRRQCGKQLPPNPASRPTMKAIVDRRRRAIDRRTVLPPAPRFEYVDDAADDPAVVLAMRPRLVRRQQRFNRRPLPVVEPELPGHDPSPRSFQLESRLRPCVNRMIEF